MVTGELNGMMTNKFDSMFYGGLAVIGIIVLALLAVAIHDIVLRNRRRRFERAIAQARREEEAIS